MLTITIPGDEVFNNETQEFETQGDIQLDLEHSLLSLSKWESRFRKAFLGPTEKSQEEVLGYVEAMIVDPEISPGVLSGLTMQNFEEINAYIESSESATTFSDIHEKKGGRGEVITAELIYFWMLTFNIPMECEKWHLNRLFALLKICSIKNSKPKKMSKQEIAERNRKLNEERRAKMGTSG